MSKIPIVTAKEVLRVLKKKGFEKVGQKGSHIKLKCNEIRTIIPYHKGKTLPPKTLKSIIKDAGLTIEEFKRLL